MDKLKKDLTTEEKILEAARKIFLVKGLDGGRMQDIADEAGINKAMLHYYFRSKEKLFEKIFTEVAGHFIPRIVRILASEDSVLDKIETFCVEYINQVMQTPYVPIFILNEINRQPEAFLKKVFGDKKPPIEKFLKQLKKEAKEGIIKEVEPIELLMNVLALCVFPFLARPIIELISGKDRGQFNDLMEKRKKEVPLIIADYLKK